LARNLATPCLGREPKAKVATIILVFKAVAIITIGGDFGHDKKKICFTKVGYLFHWSHFLGYPHFEFAHELWFI
jgi:hypothetical protein